MIELFLLSDGLLLLLETAIIEINNFLNEVLLRNETFCIQTSNNILILHNDKRNYKKAFKVFNLSLLEAFFLCIQLYIRAISTYSNLALETWDMILRVFGYVKYRKRVY